MIKLNHLIKDHLIYEGLIHSVSVDKFADIVDKWSISSTKMDIKAAGQKIVVHLEENLTSTELDNFLRLINSLGWFVSVYSVFGGLGKWKKFDRSDFENDCEDHRILAMQLEAKYDREVDPQNFDILYHTTPSVNDAKIKRIGLVPKDRGKISVHPDRIYFAQTKSDLDIINERFHQLNKDVKEYTHYSVDIRAASKNNSTIRLFVDPNFEGGIFTLSNIEAKYLTVIGGRSFSD